MRDVLGWYYINWYIKKVLMRIIEAGLEIYGGMAPQKELTFEHWVRVHLSIMHGGSTGLLSLVKAANIMARTGAGAQPVNNGTDASMSLDTFLSNGLPGDQPVKGCSPGTWFL